MQANKKNPNPGNPFENYVSRADFAKSAGITYRTAELWAHERKGPAVTIIGGRAHYHVDDIAAWLDSLRKRNSTHKPKARKVA